MVARIRTKTPSFPGKGMRAREKAAKEARKSPTATWVKAVKKLLKK
jgi:hypothetical protein